MKASIRDREALLAVSPAALSAYARAAGFLAGALVAWLYNVIAGWVGGIELAVEES